MSSPLAAWPDRLPRAITVVAMLAFALPAGEAYAGEFRVANCQSDQFNFSTSAFTELATRGMKVRRACNPEGPGLRGLTTANVVRSGRVARGSFAIVTMAAPAGTRFTNFRWAGTARRRDCRYALQLYADAPDITPISIKNVRANQHCPRAGRAQIAGYRSRSFNVTGATRIVQRVICIGGQGVESCSARGSNFIRTYKAESGISDGLAPTVRILGDSALARGEWTGGTQALGYDAIDNVGVRMAQAVVAGEAGGSEQRPCASASPAGAFATQVPCPNGQGRIGVDTRKFPEGTQQLAVQAQDTAGNVGTSIPVTARIDNTAPGRVGVAVEGGEDWRSNNDFAVAWRNPLEPDRAPVAAASYRLCQAGGGSCNGGQQSGAEISRFGVQVPGPGEWTLSLWRRDAAGNESENAASVPVAFRYDPEPPKLGFEPSPADDPTLIAVQVIDKVSGLAGGSIEISRGGSNAWQALGTRVEASRLVARIDDAGLPAGNYLLRARAFDRAHNEGSSDRRLDGQPMMLALPLRIASVMSAGVVRKRTVRRTIRRHGKRRRVRRRVTFLRSAARVPFGRRAQIAGRLTNTDDHGIAGARIQVYSRSGALPEQLLAVLESDQSGHYRYTAGAGVSRTLRFAYAGSSVILAAQSEVRLAIPALSSLRPSRRRMLNGQAVNFGGRLRTLPAPPGGKLVELQVRLSGRWQTFRTTRTDERGRWRVRYRFRRTRGLQRYRFRAALPAEAGYPYARGRSRAVTVRVRG
jgi:hypothetical protein